jgi:hypothetical protein
MARKGQKEPCRNINRCFFRTLAGTADCHVTSPTPHSPLCHFFQNATSYFYSPFNILRICPLLALSHPFLALFQSMVCPCPRLQPRRRHHQHIAPPHPFRPVRESVGCMGMSRDLKHLHTPFGCQTNFEKVKSHPPENPNMKSQPPPSTNPAGCGRHGSAA